MLQIINKLFRHHLLNFQDKNPWPHILSQGIFSKENSKEVLSFVDN